MPRLTRVAQLLTLAALAPPAAACAQDDEEDPLAQAEQAYVEVNFVQALQLGEAALASGRYGPTELERIYRLMGLAASAEGDDERAIDAYVRMFALNPEAQLDEGLSPRLQQTFMEAFGRWSARRSRLSLEARRLRDARGLGLTLEDPISMVGRVVVYSRLAGSDEEHVRTELDADGELAVPVAGLTAREGIEIYAHALDAHGNRVIELGSPYEPRVLEAEAEAAAAVAEAPVNDGPQPVRASAETAPSGGGVTPWLFGVGTVLTVGAGAVLAWSTVDVLASHEDYLAEPTLAKYYHGLDLQTRTNALVIATSALGVATAVLAIFTDWGGGSTPESAGQLRWRFVASPGGVATSLGGRF